MSARDQILGGIRSALDRAGRAEADHTEAENRLAARARNLIPARVDRDRAGLIALFREMALAVDTTIDTVPTLDEVPQAISNYLKSLNLPAQIKRSLDPVLEDLPWESAPLLDVAAGRAEDADTCSVTTALAAIAETGTLMIASGGAEADTASRTSGMGPSTLNFLPETHIVVLPADRVVGPYEDGWDKVRAILGVGQMPRTLNMITGPSRTGDIEQKVQLGAHGPRRLHIVLVDPEAA